MTYRITIDDREIELWNLLETNNTPFIEKVRLESGDIIFWRDNVPILWIERKDLDDFWASLKDGRYVWQKNNAREWRLQYPDCRILWLIEGDWDRMTPETQKRLRSAMWKLTLRDQSWVIHSPSLQNTAQDIIYLSTQTQKEPDTWEQIWTLKNTVPLPLSGGAISKAVAATSGQKKATDAKDAWTRMLLIIPGMNQEMIQMMTQKYDSTKSWIEYLSKGDLWEIKTEIENWQNGSRRWGPAIATKLITFFGFPEPEKPIRKKKMNLKASKEEETKT